MGFFENIFGGQKESSVAEPKSGLDKNGEISLTPEQKAELDSAIAKSDADKEAVNQLIQEVETAEGVDLVSIDPNDTDEKQIAKLKSEIEEAEGIKLE